MPTTYPVDSLTFPILRSLDYYRWATKVMLLVNDELQGFPYVPLQ